MNDSEGIGWILYIFILTVVLALVVWITMLSLNVFWELQFYRWAALGGYTLCIFFGIYFVVQSTQEVRDRLAFGGYTVIAVIILIWFLSMLGTRFGWWSALKIYSPL